MNDADRERILSRFWSKVNKTDSCWLWMKEKNNGGYGRFEITRHLNVLSHRFAYTAIVGPIPDGLELDHLCRVRHCVNPAHLEAVTPRENWIRGDCPSAKNARKTECRFGHPLSGGNLRLPKGRFERKCVTCLRRRDREYQKRKRAS